MYVCDHNNSQSTNVTDGWTGRQSTFSWQNRALCKYGLRAVKIIGSWIDRVAEVGYILVKICDLIVARRKRLPAKYRVAQTTTWSLD